MLHRNVTKTPEPAKSSPSYLVVSPSVLSPDVPFRLFVSNLQFQPMKFKAEILQDRDKVRDQVLSAVFTLLQGEQEELLHLPIDSEDIREGADLWLVIRGRIPSSEEDLVSNRTRLSFRPRTQTTLIQTDRPRYKPGDTVKIRVLSLQPDGTGLNETKDVFIKDPGGHLIRQWLSLDSFLGVSSLEFQLSQSPPLGEWTISATVQGVSAERRFHVEFYALPKFKVEIHAPKTIHIKDTLLGTVSAKHFHGKHVQGTLSLTFIHRSHSREETFHQTSWFDGQHKFHFDVPQMNFSNVRMSFVEGYSEEYLEIQAQVTESMTGLQYNSSLRVDLAKHLYKLSFVGHRHLLQPGSTFHVLLKVQRFDGAPPHESDLPKVQVSVLQQKTTPWSWVQIPEDYRTNQDQDKDQDQYSDQDQDSEEMELIVPEDGIIPLSIKLRNETRTIIIDASFQDSSETLMVHSSHSSPSGSYLQIQPPHSPAQAGSTVTLKIWSSFKLHKYNYLVKSRGHVVLAGSSSGDLVLDLDSVWTPTVLVLVFVVLADGEMVVDRLQLQVEQRLQNSVSLSWSVNTLKPHEGATLTATVSEPHSLVAILVVDMATMRDSAHNDITKLQVLQEMGKLDALQKEQEDMMQMGDPHSLFTECGLLVLTDASYDVVLNPLMPFLRALPALDQPTPDQTGPGQNQVHTRSHFPETWIWADLHTGTQTTAEVSGLTPDSLTSWIASAFVMSPSLGLGFMDLPVKLTVFQDFFLSLNLPPFIVRGEELLLEIHLYNYKHQDLTAQVLVENSPDLEFLSGSVDSEVRTVTVKRGSAVSVLVPVRALAVGDVMLSVRAEAPGAADHIQKSLYVKPEGVAHSFTESRLLLVSELEPEAEEQIHFSVSELEVPGSCQVHVSSVGDVLGVAMEDLDSLVQMPSGCGEQNMINLAPMVYVLQYLNSTGENHGTTVQRALELMRVGYEQELAFIRTDGSFSAFGQSDPSGSTWLSAFVLRVFLQVRSFLPVSSTVVRGMAQWLVDQQGADGRFSEPGRVIHTELVGGGDSALSLTAYVLIALTEDPRAADDFSSEVTSALLFLENGFAEGIQSHYSLSLVTYALSLTQSPNANDALDQLLQRASITDGTPMWQHHSTDPGSSPQPLSSDLESVGYLLLALHRLDRTNEGLNLVQWLSRQQNGHGGFGSTQDTVVALQALAVYASLGSGLEPDLSVVQSDGSNIKSSFTINKKNRHQLHRTLRIGGCKNSSASVKVKGRGLLLFQVNVVYNVLSDRSMRRKRYSEPDEGFSLQVTTSESQNQALNLTVCFRLALSSPLSSTGMALLKVDLLTGFSLRPQTSFDTDLVKKVETNSTSGQLFLYIDSVTRELQCVRIPLIQEFKLGQIKEGSVHLFDYYQPSRRALSFYSSERLSGSSSCSFCSSDCSDCSAHTTAATPTLHHDHDYHTAPTLQPHHYYYHYDYHTTPHTPTNYYYEDYYEDYYHHYSHHFYDVPHDHGADHSHDYEDYDHHHGDGNYDHEHDEFYDYYYHHDDHDDGHEDIFNNAASICSLWLPLLALLAPALVWV